MHICVVHPQVNKFSVIGVMSFDITIGLASCCATSLTISVHLSQCFEDSSSHQDDLHCRTTIYRAADQQSSASLCAVCQVDVSNCVVKVICESGLRGGEWSYKVSTVFISSVVRCCFEVMCSAICDMWSEPCGESVVPCVIVGFSSCVIMWFQGAYS